MVASDVVTLNDDPGRGIGTRVYHDKTRIHIHGRADVMSRMHMEARERGACIVRSSVDVIWDRSRHQTANATRLIITTDYLGIVLPYCCACRLAAASLRPETTATCTSGRNCVTIRLDLGGIGTYSIVYLGM